MTITLVVAVAENGAIGKDGHLPWKQPTDFRYFRRVTMGKPIIMGRRTFESLGKGLDGRDNIVVTSHDIDAEGAIVARSLDDALTQAEPLAEARSAAEIMVIGGAGIFREALPRADRIHWTEIHGSPEADTFFPEFDRTAWREVSREGVPAGPRDQFDMSFVVLERLG